MQSSISKGPTASRVLGTLQEHATLRRACVHQMTLSHSVDNKFLQVCTSLHKTHHDQSTTWRRQLLRLAGRRDVDNRPAKTHRICSKS
jgi:hypothetical protein